ncbi:MAG: DegT/DnrJ/EryC1/StrS aminotransferase family protein [Candidatus Methanoperedenaceae archaeon GB50]|nr:MAG: DegT/DnrJ/EryC1/StrS aminotransferase family protein [Candidatus Methanoperedenaceae archaeon GB50]
MEKGEVVLYWYQSEGNKILDTGIKQNLHRFFCRILKRRDDGAFVRVSASINGNSKEILPKVYAFTKQILTPASTLLAPRKRNMKFLLSTSIWKSYSYLPHIYGQQVSFSENTQGEDGFQEIIKTYLKVKHCLLVSSGTAALWLILKAAKEIEQKRNEVIIPAYTCPSVAAAVIRAGLKPILCDINICKTLVLNSRH